MSKPKYMLAVLLIFLPACTSTLRDRVDGLWKARVSGDCPTVQKFEDPRTPGGMHRDEYIKFCQEREPFLYKSYNVVDIQSDRDWGWVDVKYSSVIRGHENIPARESTLNERWQRYNKQWFLVPKDKQDRMPSTPKVRNMKEEPKLQARFMQTWEARKANDWKKLYELLDPKDRETIPLKEYSEGEAKFDILKADLQWVEVIGEKGRVLVDYLAKPSDIKLIDPINVPKFEDWILVNGEWYRDIKRDEK